MSTYSSVALVKMDVTFKQDQKKKKKHSTATPPKRSDTFFTKPAFQRNISSPTFSPKDRMPQNRDIVIQCGTLIIQIGSNMAIYVSCSAFSLSSLMHQSILSSPTCGVSAWNHHLPQNLVLVIERKQKNCVRTLLKMNSCILDCCFVDDVRLLEVTDFSKLKKNIILKLTLVIKKTHNPQTTPPYTSTSQSNLLGLLKSFTFSCTFFIFLAPVQKHWEN